MTYRGEDLTPEQAEALTRHGYDASLLPRGVAGGPERVKAGYEGQPNPWPGHPWLRNRVCFLDGIEIDGHEFSDLDIPGPGTRCLHCDYEIPEYTYT